MTDADLMKMFAEAEERARGAAEAAAYERGRRNALREVLERLRAAAAPPPAEEAPAHE